MMNIPEAIRCSVCDSALAEGAAICDSCGQKPRGRGKSFRQRLLWLVKAYRTWSLAVFVYALVQLAMLGHAGAYIMLFFILVPFGMALWISYRMGDATSRWIVAFLILVDLGVIIAPEHRLLPMLNMFPQLPRTENRILTWFFLVYILLQFVAVPPVVFSRSLRTAWRGGTPLLSPWICGLGFAVWGLIVAIVILCLAQFLGLLR